MNIIPHLFNEKESALVINEIVIDEDYQKSDTEIETYESLED